MASLAGVAGSMMKPSERSESVSAMASPLKPLEAILRVLVEMRREEDCQPSFPFPEGLGMRDGVASGARGQGCCQDFGYFHCFGFSLE